VQEALVVPPSRNAGEQGCARRERESTEERAGERNIEMKIIRQE